MTSYRNKTEQIIEESDKVYNTCWDTLCALKQVRINENFADSIFNFQIDLARFLFKIENLRQEIKNEEKRISSNKNKYDYNWFVKRLKTLSNYKKALFALTILGKSLGDAFAWWFYRFDLELLNEHSDHERTLHPPLGIGGTGELEFIDRFRHLQEKFVIYHGITNILRIGDVSFFDFRKNNIVSIGEIKTKESGLNLININLIMFGPKSRKGFSVENKEAKKLEIDYFDKERLGRQINTMIKALKVYDQPESPIEKIEDKYHSKEVEKLFMISSSSKLSYLQVSDGLLLSAIKTKSQNSKSKFLDNVPFIQKEKDKIEGVSYLSKITKKDSEYNSLIFGGLQYNEKGFNNFTRGSIPLFWMAINNDILKEIYFYEFQVFTLFNPIHLIEKIIEQGINIESNFYKNGFSVKSQNKPYMKLESFDLFIPYIVNHLQTEQSVLSILRHFITDYSKFKGANKMKIELRMQQMLYEYMIKPSR